MIGWSWIAKMSNRTALTVATSGLLLLLTACSTVNVTTDYDHNFSFAGHETFAWVSEHPMVAHSPDVSPLAEGRLERAIIDAMQRNGIRYVENAADADLLVGFSLGSKQQIRVTPGFYSASYWGRYPWIGAYYDSINIEQYSVDRLTIDVFDQQREVPIWHGTATKVAGIANEQKGEGMARNAVAKMLADFPPPSALD
jgi:Domain of unknown function (DUF4136)